MDGCLGYSHCRPVALHLRLGGPQRGLGHIGVGHGLVALAGGDSSVLERILESPAVRPGKLQDGPLLRDASDARYQRGPRPVC